MGVNRVVVHKRNPNPSHIDQLGTTIPMAELFASSDDAHLLPKPKPERAPRLIPVPLEKAMVSGDLPEAFAPVRSVRAVILELDRLFPEASRWHLEALDCALRKFGLELPPAMTGSVKDALETMSQERRLPRFLHKAVEGVAKTFFEELLRTHCCARVENEILVSRLHAQGIRIAVRSPLPAKKTRLILDMSGLRAHVDDLVCCDDLAAKGCAKEELLAICEHLGLRPDQVVAVEGDPEGIESARSAGLRTCGLRPKELAEWPRIQRFVSRIESAKEGSGEC